jgi:hypothetical protein
MRYRLLFSPPVFSFLLQSPLFFASLLFLLPACDNCADPAMVTIPDADATPPVLHWEVVVQSNTPSGPISSMTQYYDAASNITVKSNDDVDVYLVGTDEESGIKKITLKGGFGYLCTPAGSEVSMAVGGLIPEGGVDFSMLTKCALRGWRLSKESLDLNFQCDPNSTAGNRSISLQGNSINHKDGAGESTLTIEVID